MILLEHFSGKFFRTAENWFRTIPTVLYTNRPIRYLEVGAYHGANIISVAQTYGAHPDSVLECIDPWEDYGDYAEYRHEHAANYETFLANVAACGVAHKIKHHRGFSHQVIPTFPDAHFDMIYIDGNHAPEYVLEDAVLSFRKLKTDGVLIFDDYGWGGPERGIDAFLSAYHARIQVIGDGPVNTQLFVGKRG